MIVIVRHGNTFEAGQAPRRVGARTDIPLTEAGWQQGLALGSHFAARNWSFGRVLVSPLLRTRQTAAAILSAHAIAVDPEVADFLREIDHGPDENKPEDEVIARIGHPALDAWDEDGTPPPGWTTDAASRIAVWQGLFADHAANAAPTLLVTSNGAARFAFLAAPDLRDRSAMPSLKLPTGGYGVIARNPDGNLRAVEWGQRP